MSHDNQPANEQPKFFPTEELWLEASIIYEQHVGSYFDLLAFDHWLYVTLEKSGRDRRSNKVKKVDLIMHLPRVKAEQP